MEESKKTKSRSNDADSYLKVIIAKEGGNRRDKTQAKVQNISDSNTECQVRSVKWGKKSKTYVLGIYLDIASTKERL